MSKSEPPADRSPTPSVESPDPPPELDHATVENEDGKTECTIFPGDRKDHEIVTRWITAEEGSFIDLEQMR